MLPVGPPCTQLLVGCTVFSGRDHQRVGVCSGRGRETPAALRL